MAEIEDANNDIDYNKLLFIGSNKEKFKLNILSTPLNFISAIYDGEISLKEVNISQRKIQKKIEELNGKDQKIQKKRRRNKWSIDASK